MELEDKLEERLKRKVLENSQIEEKISIYHAQYELLKEEVEKITFLSNRIEESMTKDIEEVDIYTSLFSSKDLRLHEKYFFPIYKEDVSNWNKPIFLDMNFFDIEKFISIFDKEEGIKIKGKISIDLEEYDVTFNFVKEKKYIEKIKEFYKITQLNKIKWKNIYCPYAYKSFSLELFEYDAEVELKLIDSNNKDIKVIVDYPAEIKDYIIEDKVLIWNVFETIVMPEILVRPTHEIIYYEHSSDSVGDIDFVGLEVYDFEFSYAHNGYLKIVTSNRKYEIIKIYSVFNVPRTDALSNLKLFGNNKNYKYVKHIRKEIPEVLRNFDDIEETLNLYESFQEIRIYKHESRGEEKIETYALGIHEKNEFSIKNRKKKLNINVSHLKTEYVNDLVSFLKEELETYLIDYNCTFFHNIEDQE